MTKKYVVLIKFVNTKHAVQKQIRLYQTNYYYQIPQNQYLHVKQAVLVKNDQCDVKQNKYPKYALGVVMKIKRVANPDRYADKIKLAPDIYFNDFYMKRNGYNKIMDFADYPDLAKAYYQSQRLMALLD